MEDPTDWFMSPGEDQVLPVFFIVLRILTRSPLNFFTKPVVFQEYPVHVLYRNNRRRIF
jgi:hypothetical protein